jgi:hypothetical protein
MNSGVAGLVAAWLVVGVIISVVTGAYAFWPILIFGLITGVAIANKILHR